MEQRNKAILIALPFFLVGCGVKGRPLPPLTPPPIGRGESTQAQSSQKKEPSKNRYDAAREYEEDEQ